MTRFQFLSDVQRFLDQLPSFQAHGAIAARLGLDPIRSFCDQIGNPERDVPFVHVAGTNGKGSVSAILAKVYQEAGYRCGVFTSPHLEHILERFRINGQMIPEDDFLQFFEMHGQRVVALNLSYFEITTALAFWWFSKQKADIAILETGLGGRLDATNIINPEVSVITSVGYDHRNFLGHTAARIAEEKGGIIKKGRPVVIGQLPAPARKVITSIAQQKGSELLDARDMRPRFQLEKRGDEVIGRIRFTENGRRVSVATDLPAPVHRWNVAIARLVTLANSGRFSVTLPAFRRASGAVVAHGFLPGRFERLDRSLNWYFDGAHNSEAVRALTKTIETQDWQDSPVIVMSFMKDKAEKKVLKPFSVFKKNYYYKLNTERAADISEIKPYLSNIKSLPSREEDITKFLAGLTEEVVIFTGSFYFYGVVKRWISRIIKA